MFDGVASAVLAVGTGAGAGAGAELGTGAGAGEDAWAGAAEAKLKAGGEAAASAVKTIPANGLLLGSSFWYLSFNFWSKSSSLPVYCGENVRQAKARQ